MSEKMLDLLKSLCATPGPVGREDLVQDAVMEHLKAYCTNIERDRIGNLSATMEGAGKHYAVVAHADEVGFLISNIDSNGFLQAKWNTQGHIPDLRLLPGQMVLIMKEDGFIPGYFCVKTAHIAGAQGKNKIPTWEEVFIDIGMNSKEEVKELGINIGDPVIYASPVEKIGNNVMGKTFDDRVGLVVMILLAEKLSVIPKEKRPTVTFVSTVMEEIGAKGVAAIAGALNVDGVFVVDIGLADDYPGTKGEAGVALGKGPVIVIKDSQIVYSHELNKRLFATAEKNEIAIQRAVYHNYATDGFPIISLGQPASVVAVPCRYSHSSFEAINLDDVDKTIRLLEALFLEL